VPEPSSPYRKLARKAEERRTTVEVARFASQLEAELAKNRLEQSGIQAHVLELASSLGNIAGGVRLSVDRADADAAVAVLGQPEPISDDALETDDPDSIRCPLCEMPDCRFDRPAFEAPGYAVALVFPVPILYAAHLLKKRRWVCTKCGFDFEDPKLGATGFTKLPEGEPRPVFALVRTYEIGGAIAGLIVGFVVRSVYFPYGGPGALIGILFLVGGWILGRFVRKLVCSEPTCRAPLDAGDVRCGRCGGAVHGTIERARDHYSRAAKIRRRLAEDAMARAARRAKKPKKLAQGRATAVGDREGIELASRKRS